MTREEAIIVIKSHKSHWQRLLKEKICDETEGKETIESLELAMSALSVESCEDCISRQAVLDIAKTSKSNWIDNSVLFKKVNELPSVQPIRPKGEWVEHEVEKEWYKCSVCGSCWDKGEVENCNINFCPNCGADMRGKADEG